MSACTFFGHRDAPWEIECKLYGIVRDLIDDKSVDTFYVGNNGGFDKIVMKTLKKVTNEKKQIKYYVVLAYHPQNKKCEGDLGDTIYPEELSTFYPRFAIKKRNEWMIQRSDYVVSYVKNATGGAWFYMNYASKKGKIIINIAE